MGALMFTGIVTEVGRVAALAPQAGGRDTRITIAAPQTARGLALGASVACSGVCLTVTEFDGETFGVEVSGETLARTNLGGWHPGARVNLERSLRLGDELGGHLVSGHVDGVARIVGWRPIAGSVDAEFAVDRSLGRFVAVKGSIALDGVSLTVNRVSDDGGETRFAVNLIAHTCAVTNFGAAALGQRVNVEVDTLARYVARLKEV